jgi:putative membrane protein
LAIFRQKLATARASAKLAANQGLYNAFLAAGLIWSLLHPNGAFSAQLDFFFLGCVLVAGIFGALTVGRTILFVQAGPAALALLFLAFS